MQLPKNLKIYETPKKTQISEGEKRKKFNKKYFN